MITSIISCLGLNKWLSLLANGERGSEAGRADLLVLRSFGKTKPVYMDVSGKQPKQAFIIVEYNI